MKVKDLPAHGTVAMKPKQQLAERSIAYPAAGPVSGTLVGFSAHGDPWVEFHGNVLPTPASARSCVPLDSSHVGRGIVLFFEGGDPKLPIVMGLLQTHRTAAAPSELVHSDHDAASPHWNLDGKNLDFSAQESITLRCGESSITLNRNGKIVIRGIHVVSHAAGINRIRGGSVQLN